MKTSVALCTYNGEKFLKQQIDSILEQTKQVDEIVVCDDGSKDSTLQILEDYRNRYPNLFRIYSNENNLGSIKNFEKAIGLCTYEIIFLSDQDDIWLPEKVAEYCEYFQNHPEIEVLASNGFGIDEEGKVLDVFTLWDIIVEQKKMDPQFSYFEILNFVGNFATGASMAFRKEFIAECFPFPIIRDLHHDGWIALVAVSKNSLELLPGKYFKYRKHNDQQVGGVLFKNIPKLKKRIQRFVSIHDLSNQSFGNYKNILKRLSVAYDRNRLLKDVSEFYRPLFENNLKIIEDLFSTYTQRMRNKYPTRYHLLNIVDKIKNKRQLNRE